ncbi:hypothetical protein B0T14DRAFT_37308 [Immersiella caudata]|uniref:Uncharacterized protein n=1 Tax=Immersiella caudata TaxID=314043 RepID=A0AA40CBZ1_9PEZI|nr:hypothetical protein B0T14DRAFT_37308 [Immersiella caudata]
MGKPLSWRFRWTATQMGFSLAAYHPFIHWLVSARLLPREFHSSCGTQGLVLCGRFAATCRNTSVLVFLLYSVHGHSALIPPVGRFSKERRVGHKDRQPHPPGHPVVCLSRPRKLSSRNWGPRFL